jgi:hypothetical protein
MLGNFSRHEQPSARHHRAPFAIAIAIAIAIACTSKPFRTANTMTAMPTTPSSATRQSSTIKLGLAAFCLSLAACGSSPSAPPAPPPKPNLQFVDLGGFDRELSSSLGAKLPSVDVAFIDVIKPSAIPERLQRWMASVEAGGGSVKVTPPKSEFQPRAVFAIVSAITGLWSASKMAKEVSQDQEFKSAQKYDAEIVLKADGKGDAIVDKVLFRQRTTK